MIITHHPIILASGSSIRRQMLEASGLPFQVKASPVDEDALKLTLANTPVHEQAAVLAGAKAQAVSMLEPHAFVIGGDQICALGEQTFGKSGSKEGSKQQLRNLSGKTHQQVSAVCVWKDGKEIWSHVDVAELTVRTLSEDEINAYIELDMPTHCAGSYKFEAHGVHLFEKVKGSSHTIQGMPLLPLLAALREHGVYSLSKEVAHA